MPRTEHTINDVLAELLRATRRAWREGDIVTSEDTGRLKGTSAQPDILVLEPNVSPVAIETEVLPATTVESDALSRLGAQLRTTGRSILSSIAVRLPQHLRQKYGSALQKDLAAAADLEMALYTGSSPAAVSRFPHAGWIRGTLSDLSLLAQSASVPPDLIESATNQLEAGVSEPRAG